MSLNNRFTNRNLNKRFPSDSAAQPGIGSALARRA